jgi:hypothetical protein
MRHINWTKLALAVVFGLGALGQVGCAGKFTGGGWMDSLAGAPAKATMGFNFEASEDDEGNFTYSGQFEYHDNGSFPGFRKGVGFHGVVDEVDIFEDIAVSELFVFGLFFDFGEEGLAGDWVYVTGTYTPQPANLGAGGRFEAIIADSGTPRVADPSDFVVIHIIGGVFDGYANGGFLKGGNITFHPPGD